MPCSPLCTCRCVLLTVSQARSYDRDPRHVPGLLTRTESRAVTAGHFNLTLHTTAFRAGSLGTYVWPLCWGHAS